MFKLPDQKFFEPNENFYNFMWFRYQDKNTIIYDVGAGLGHVTEGLREINWFNNVIPIDMFLRESSIPDMVLSDGTEFLYEPDSIVMLCRPCHGAFPEAVINQAIYRNCREILYIGLPNNKNMDTGEYSEEFKLIWPNHDLEFGSSGEKIWLKEVLVLKFNFHCARM